MLPGVTTAVDRRRRARAIASVTVMALLGASALVAPWVTPFTSAAASFGTSVHFGGEGLGAPGRDRVLVPVDGTTANLGATDFTVEFWMAAAGADNTGTSVSCNVPSTTWIHGRVVLDRDRWPAGAGPEGRDWGVSVTSDGRVAFGVMTANGSAAGGPAWTACTGGVNALDGAWHHIAVQRTVTGAMEIWVDGTRRAAAAGPAGDLSFPHGWPSAHAATDAYLGIGAEKADATAAFPAYKGYLDELRLSTLRRYGTTFARPTGPFVPDSATAALYHFDGAAGLCPPTLADATARTGALCRADAAGPVLSPTVPAVHQDPAPPAAPGQPAGTSGFHPIAALRLADTRPRALLGSQTLAVQVTGRGGVPSGAASASLNLTVVAPGVPGWLSAWPCDQRRPATSNLNFSAGRSVANLAVVGLSRSGQVCVFASVSTAVLVDVQGWWGGSGLGFAAVAPARLIDSRPGRVDGVTVVRVAGRGAVPATATAVALRVSIIGAAAPGFAVAFPCGQPRPATSNLNYAPGDTVSNLATVALGAGGTACVDVEGAASLAVDVTGWWGAGGLGYVVGGVGPVRAADTRPTRVPAGGVVVVPAPANVGIAALDLVAVAAGGAGSLTAYPCDEVAPASPTVSFGAGGTVAGSAFVPAGSDGRICVRATSPADVVVDLFGAMVVSGVTRQAVGTRLYALQWGFTQLGDQYAAINPYRFGDSTWGKRWDCPAGWTSCSRVDLHGGVRTANAGDWVYDCSGFAVAAYQRAGIDLVRLNAGWSDAMYASLPFVPQAQIEPGDLVLFGEGTKNPADPTDHVGMYLAGNTMLQAGGGCSWGLGVCVTSIDWTRVVGIARPRMPTTAPMATSSTSALASERARSPNAYGGTG